ncbi:MAG: hypothetical protein HY209_01065 [Candidatus Omnitrophica bacterium]|nr:hypothetical protein [Candidatus Omnitrophota bacterium]
MSLFSLTSLLLSILCGLLAVYIFFSSKETLYKLWSLFNGVVCLWGLFLFLASLSRIESESLIFWKFSLLAPSLMPSILLRFINALTDKDNKNFKKLCDVYAAISVILILETNLFIKNGSFYFDTFYYIKSTKAMSIWLIFFVLSICKILWNLFEFTRNEKGLKSTQATYIFWGMSVGFLGGLSVALPSYGFKIFPIGHILVSVYAATVTFAIKREFIDMKLSLIKLLIPFLIVISAVVGYCLTNFHLNLFALAGLLLGSACFTLAYVILAYANQRMHHIWAIFNVCIGIWGAGTFFVGVSNKPTIALIAWKIAYIGVLLLPVLFYHMIYIFCDLKNKKFLTFAYAQVIFVLLVNIFTNQFIGRLEYVFNSFYYHRVTSVYLFFFVIWVTVAINTFFRLYRFIKTSEGLKRTQALYLFWGMLLGFAGGTTVVAPAFGIPIYPYGHFFICIYAAICTYAIFRYQVLDIRVAITRLGVFVLVYSLVLGVPFGLIIWGKLWLFKLMGENWFWAPMSTLLILATAGPFMYIYFQSRAEEQILKEERRIQSLIQKTSIGMVAIRDLNKLLKVIIDVLGKNLQLEHISVYLFDPNENIYNQKASDKIEEEGFVLEHDDLLVQELKKRKSPLYYEEINHLLHNQKDSNGELKALVDRMQKLSASVIVPASKEDILLAFIVLGKRGKKEVYSPELLDVLGVVGNEAALAIENAIFYEESGKDWSERAHDARLKMMGAMGSGIAHQINNKFHAIGFQLNYLKELSEVSDLTKMTPDDLRKSQQELKDEIGKILTEIDRSVEIVQAIKNYAKRTGAEPQVTSFKEVVTGAKHLAKMIRKDNDVEYELIEDYPENVLLWVNFSMLQDVFVNAFDNSRDALILKKYRLGKDAQKLEEYKPKITVSGRANTTMFDFVIEDNGMGIEKHHLEEGQGVNVMYFTTKGAVKGTGMGIAMMRQFAKHNRGGLKIESEYGQWTRITISLPLATPEQIKGGSNEPKNGR